MESIPSKRSALVTLFATSALALTGCSGSSDNRGPGGRSGDNRLVSIEYGKLADVYGLTEISGTKTIALYQKDALVSPQISDERDANSRRADDEVLYDFINSDPDTLQPRLLITRAIGSEAFHAAFDDLDTGLPRISATKISPKRGPGGYPVVARNAAIRLTFSEPLDLPADFFYDLDPEGNVIGVKNTEAVQLLQIVGDPNDRLHEGDFRQLPMRVVVRGTTMVLDPVLLGSEGLQIGAPNSAAGLPESPDRQGANIRIALALDGPLAIPGLDAGRLTGTNNGAVTSVVRDFRSGHRLDNSSNLARGFVRDPVPPRLVGEMRMYLEDVESFGAGGRILTIFKNDISHEIDRGDVLRLFVGESGKPAAVAEIIRDPEDDHGKPSEPHVRVLVRPIFAANGVDVLEAMDPSNLPRYPRQRGEERDEFLRRYAPRAVLVAEYTHRRLRPDSNPADPLSYYGDDTRHFLTFSPTPLSDAGSATPAENVSPFADATIRFSKPIDLTTASGFDTLFFATRDVLTIESEEKRPFDDIKTFLEKRDIDPAAFDLDKFRTPHLIASRTFDANGSQTAIRLQTPLGFYLDETMRQHAEQDAELPFSERRHHYFLHLVGGPKGIHDLSGNALDFQAIAAPGTKPLDFIAMQFGVDSRYRPGTNEGRFADNIVVSIVRRFADADEDERPNYYRPEETKKNGQATPGMALAYADLFGPISHSDDGRLLPRTGTRVSKVLDDINQLPPPSQSSPLRWCPITLYGRGQISNPTGNTTFGQAIQNPFHPLGCRLQMAWREIDMSLSRTDPLDLNLDVEQMYWAPFAENAVYFDEFDRVSLFLGHSEYRPEPCIDARSRFPSMPGSGLKPNFAGNYAKNFDVRGKVGERPNPHPAFVDKIVTMNANNSVPEPRGINYFLPLPKFIDATKGSQAKNPFFVWRDELESVQGGIAGIDPRAVSPYILSPFMAGLGRDYRSLTTTCPKWGAWDNANNQHLTDGRRDFFTDGLLGTIALPLLADFWVYPDSAELPKQDPFLASGVNGWQISLAVTGSSRPNFRVYSSGRPGVPGTKMDTTQPGWRNAVGGWDYTGTTKTPPGDNSVYWVMVDFLKRTSVVTSGFVEIANPHRMRPGGDPRLGPYDTRDTLPVFDTEIGPAQQALPAGTTVVTEFRGASALDRPNPYWPRLLQMPARCEPSAAIRPTIDNFPLDPFKAGDAGLKHMDIRGGRNFWAHPYNRTVTDYVPSPNNLMDEAFTNRFSGRGESFQPEDVKYFNWRFIMRNNVAVSPPVSPTLDSFFVSYRLVRR
jgi:hypothetical protein